MDGTLLDTIHDIGACLNLAKERCGVSTEGKSPEDYVAYIGYAIDGLIKRSSPDGTSEEKLREILQVYQPLYNEHCADVTAPYAGITEALLRLKAEGYRLAIITNKVESCARFLADKLFPENLFELVWGNDGVRPHKPAKDAGDALCQAMGVTPDQVVYVGDSGFTDMKFGKASGFFSLGVTWGYRDEAELLENGADAVAHNAEEMTDILLSL